jgi:hypothetical protein
MTTRLDKTLKRELLLDKRSFIVALSPEGLKVTQKGKRNGVELKWRDLISGDAALAAALNASVGRLESTETASPRAERPRRRPGGRAKAKRR